MLPNNGRVACLPCEVRFAPALTLDAPNSVCFVVATLQEKEVLQLAVQINAKLEGQPGLRQAAREDELEVDLTGPSTQHEPAPPALPLHPWADRSAGVTGRPPVERSLSLFTDSFVRRTQGILRDVMEPTDNELEFQQKKQASTLAVKRVQQLEVSFGALLRKVDAAIEHGAEEAAERLQRELREVCRMSKFPTPACALLSCHHGVLAAVADRAVAAIGAGAASATGKSRPSLPGVCCKVGFLTTSSWPCFRLSLQRKRS